MRHMPSQITDDAGNVVSIPIANDWTGSVLRLVGRPLTTEETAKLARLRSHNWTVRLAAEMILKRDVTIEELRAADVR